MHANWASLCANSRACSPGNNRRWAKEKPPLKKTHLPRPKVWLNLELSEAATGQAEVWASLFSSLLLHLTTENKTTYQPAELQHQTVSAVSKLQTWKLHNPHSLFPPGMEKNYHPFTQSIPLKDQGSANTFLSYLCFFSPVSSLTPLKSTDLII